MSNLPEDPEKRRVVLRRAEVLASLKGHPGFEQLADEAIRKANREKRRLTNIMLSDEGLSKEDARHWAGFFKGMNYLLALPAGAEMTMEEARELESELREEGTR